MARGAAVFSAKILQSAASAWRLALRRARSFRVVLLVLLFASAAGPGSAVSQGTGVTTSHGYAVYGELKYGPDFEHLEFANPDAPKGGFYRASGGRVFDSLNQFSLMGNFPYVIEYLFDPLMERTQDEPVSYYGIIARTITYPEDLSWVEFELRPEARWHDGKPITVDDVLFTVEALKDPLIRPQKNVGAKAVTRAYQTGPHRVRMELNQKNNPVLPAAVASMKVLPKHYFVHHDLTQPNLQRPVSSGPYKIGRFDSGRMFEFVRDKNYWAADLPMRKGRFNFDRVEHVYHRDPQASFQDFYTGRIHTQQDFSARRWQSEDALPAYAAGDILRDNIPYKNSAFYMSITMNTRRPFLSDRRVRQAIQLAYDFEFSREIILHGHHGRTASYFANTEFEASGLPSPGELELLEPFRDRLPPELFTEAPDVPVGGSRANQRQNLKQARDLLSQAGYRIENMKLVDPETGQPIVLEFVAFSPNLLSQASQFMRNLERLGIEVEFRHFEASQFRLVSGNYQFDLMLGNAAFGPQDAPGSELLTSWSSEAAKIPNQLNFAGIADPAIDHALDTILSASDRQTVVDAMRAIDRVARFNYYSIPMQHTYPAPVGQKPLAYWDRFGRPQNFDVTYIYPLMMLDHWWWDPEKEAQLSHGVFK